MKLVRMIDSKGNVAYLNPDHVAMVSGASAGCVPSVGETAVTLLNGITLGFRGTLEEISGKLSAPESFEK